MAEPFRHEDPREEDRTRPRHMVVVKRQGTSGWVKAVLIVLVVLVVALLVVGGIGLSQLGRMNATLQSQSQTLTGIQGEITRGFYTIQLGLAQIQRTLAQITQELGRIAAGVSALAHRR